MNDGTKEMSLGQEAMSLYRQHWKRYLPIQFNFLMIALAVFALAVFFPETLIITVPLALIPFYFSFHLSIEKATAKEGNNIPFFFGFKRYFRMPHSGSYRLLKNLLFGFLFGMAASFVAGIVTYIVLMNVDPSFVSTIEELMDAYLKNDFDYVLALLDKSSSLTLYMSIDAATMFGVMASYMVLMMGYGTLNVELRVMFPIGVSSSRGLNALARQAYKGLPSENRKDYKKATWFLFLIYAVGFAGGLILGISIFADPLSWVAMGLAVGLMLLMPFLPYLILVVFAFMKKHRKELVLFSIESAKQNIKAMASQNPELGKDEADKMISDLDRIKGDIESKKDENLVETEEGNDEDSQE